MSKGPKRNSWNGRERGSVGPRTGIDFGAAGRPTGRLTSRDCLLSSFLKCEAVRVRDFFVGCDFYPFQLGNCIRRTRHQNSTKELDDGSMNKPNLRTRSTEGCKIVPAKFWQLSQNFTKLADLAVYGWSSFLAALGAGIFKHAGIIIHNFTILHNFT